MSSAEKEKLTGNDCCVYMHTALRKVCESKATSALYNAVTVICDAKPSKLNAWRVFGEVIAQETNAPGPTFLMRPDFMIKKFDTYFFDVRAKEHYDKIGQHTLPEKAWPNFYLLKCLLELLTQEDWENMLSYICEERDV